MPAQERIYFIGGTGGCGSAAVKLVLERGYPVTIYTRKPEASEFKSNPNVTLVQGDYDDWTPFEKSIGGHTRLFLLIGSMVDMAGRKGTIAKIAYTAGVQQIVDISSLTINACPWYHVARAHAGGEDAINALPERKGRSYVALRPWRFYSNFFHLKEAIKAGTFVTVTDPDVLQGFISPNDIGLLAANVLTDPVEKHGDAIYLMVGHRYTPQQRADIVSKVLGKPVALAQWSYKEQYNLFINMFHLPHSGAYDFSADAIPDPDYSPQLELALGRKPETLEEWFEKNKAAFL